MLEPTPGSTTLLLVSSFAFPFLLINLINVQLLCALPGSTERNLLPMGRGLASTAVLGNFGLVTQPDVGPAMAQPRRTLCGARMSLEQGCSAGCQRFPKGWSGSLAVPAPWDLPAVPTVPRPAEEVAAVCHAGIPFPRGCQVRATRFHWSRKQRRYAGELGPFSACQ